MSAWLTWFQNYLNPSKLTAVTVPGMVVAFALILVLGPVPCRTNADCPYCTGQLKPADGDDAKPTSVNPPAQTAVAGNCEFPPSTTPGKADDKATMLCVRVSNQMIQAESTIGDINHLIDTVNAPPPAAQNTPDVEQLEKALNLGKVDPLKEVTPNHNPLSCGDLPSFVVPSSLAAVDRKGISKAQNAAIKAGQSLDRLDSLQPTLTACNGQLQKVNAQLQQNAAALQIVITQANTDLTGLSTNLVSAQNTGEALVADSLKRKIADKRSLLGWALGAQTAITSSTNALKALQARVTAIVQLGTTPPAETAKDTSPVQDVMATIQDNLIKFLVLSLIIGTILDPLQRGAVSLFGPRRSFFEAFNLVYGQGGDGEFRYGDRRVLPWLRNDGTILPDPRAEEKLNMEANPAELRANAAARAFVKDRNIYDRNYAVGAGYISESDAKMIEDNYFSQSQITSGLILPMFVLSICLGIREVCCSSPLSKASFWPSTFILAVLPFGVLVSGLMTLAGLLLSSGKYSQLVFATLKNYLSWTADDPIRDAEVKDATRKHRETKEHLDAVRLHIGPLRKENPHFDEKSFLATAQGSEKGALETLQKSEYRRDREKRERQLGRWRQHIMIIIGAIFLVIGVIEFVLPYDGIERGELFEIMLPVLFVFPLWIGGLDRLHKFYSELQSRIAGNVLRLEATTEQKFMDLLSDDTAACAMKAKFKSTVEARKSLDALLKDRKCKTENNDGDPPAGDRSSTASSTPSGNGGAAAGGNAPPGNGGGA